MFVDSFSGNNRVEVRVGVTVRREFMVQPRGHKLWGNKLDFPVSADVKLLELLVNHLILL